jgi:hypothetical protein
MIDTAPQLVTSGCPTEVNLTMPARAFRPSCDVEAIVAAYAGVNVDRTRKPVPGIGKLRVIEVA